MKQFKMQLEAAQQNTIVSLLSLNHFYIDSIQ